MLRRMRVWALVACGVVGISLPARADVAPNLIVNGDAEEGEGSSDGYVPVTIPSWIKTGVPNVVPWAVGNGFPDAGTPGPTDRGLNYFTGGTGGATIGTLSQTIDVSSSSAAIDAGTAPFTLCGYLGGYLIQSDNVMVLAEFLDGAAGELGSASIGPVTTADRASTTALLLESTSGTVPSGTRTVDVTVTFTRINGAYGDGYADNLNFLLASCCPEAGGCGTTTSTSTPPSTSTTTAPTTSSTVPAPSTTTVPTSSTVPTTVTTSSTSIPDTTLTTTSSTSSSTSTTTDASTTVTTSSTTTVTTSSTTTLTTPSTTTVTTTSTTTVTTSSSTTAVPSTYHVQHHDGAHDRHDVEHDVGASTVTTSTAVPPTVTTTTAPGGAAAATFASVLCRLDALADDVASATDLGTRQAKLATLISVARGRATQAETAPSVRKQKALLAAAAKKLAAFVHQLSSRGAQKAIPEATRSRLASRRRRSESILTLRRNATRARASAAADRRALRLAIAGRERPHTAPPTRLDVTEAPSTTVVRNGPVGTPSWARLATSAKAIPFPRARRSLKRRLRSPPAEPGVHAGGSTLPDAFA